MDWVLRILLMKIKTQDNLKNYLKVLNFHGYGRPFWGRELKRNVIKKSINDCVI